MNELSMFEQNIYNTYLKTSRNKQGFTPRKNFKDLNDEKYTLLKKISQTLKNKKIDPNIFFQAPYQLYSEKYVPLKFYSTFGAISAYKKYVEEIELTTPDNPFNITRLRNGFKFIYDKCIESNATDCKDYLNIQNGIYPDFILDLKQNYISYYCLLTLDLSEKNINLEKNIVEFVCKGFYNTLSSLRSKYVFSKKLKPLGIKLTKTINKILKTK
tara:strand:- start:926 stop:1567 length:642 start_codon:yes stop_codon:yes gene_type:complete